MQSPRASAQFWDQRILDWEASRYEGRWKIALGPSEWLAGALSGPTRLRRQRCLELLAPFLNGKKVTEVGCGTGRLAALFLEAGAAAYLGLDHSRVAIEEARRRYAGESRISFEVGSAGELPKGTQIVVSLGLLDWLGDEELRAFFSRHDGADFLHTFSERRGSPRQLLHRACRWIDALARPRAVRPRFMSLEQVTSFLPSGARAPAVHREAGLRDAAFISSLPIKAP